MRALVHSGHALEPLFSSVLCERGVVMRSSAGGQSVRTWWVCIWCSANHMRAFVVFCPGPMGGRLRAPRSCNTYDRHPALR